jgi:hypothetical protein
MLPRIQGDCPVLVFSALAVKQFDFTTFIVQPDKLQGATQAEGGSHGRM